MEFFVWLFVFWGDGGVWLGLKGKKSFFNKMYMNWSLRDRNKVVRILLVVRDGKLQMWPERDTHFSDNRREGTLYILDLDQRFAFSVHRSTSQPYR